MPDMPVSNPPVLYYRTDDMSALARRVPELMEAAELQRRANMPPSPSTRRMLFGIIFGLLTERPSRKMYGGWALDAALRMVPPGQGGLGGSLYADPTDPPDVEFYSPEPLRDLRDICDRAHSAGLRYVQGREAAHPNTFTVSVEFVRLCDITYMPPEVLAHVPTLAVPMRACSDGSLLSDSPPAAPVPAPAELHVVLPEFGVIDQLRQVCDPMCAFWRLDRTLERLALADRMFHCVGGISPEAAASWDGLASLIKMGVLMAAPYEAPDDHARRAAFVWLAGRPSCVAVGSAAYRFFMQAAGDTAAGVLAPVQITVVSVDYERDVRELTQLLLAGPCGAEVSAQETHPFLDLMGRSVVLRLARMPVVTVLDAFHRAVPVCEGGSGQPDGLRDPATGVRVASFAYTMMMMHAMRFRAITEGQLVRAGVMKFMASDMCRARVAFLAARGLTAADPAAAPFCEFTRTHVGHSLSMMHVHMLQNDARREQFGSGAWFTYDPSARDRRAAAARNTTAGTAGTAAKAYRFLACGGEAIRSAADSVLTPVAIANVAALAAATACISLTGGVSSQASVLAAANGAASAVTSAIAQQHADHDASAHRRRRRGGVSRNKKQGGGRGPQQDQ